MIYLHSEKKAVLQSLIAREFREYRKAHGLSQVKFAKQLQIVVRSYIDSEHGLFLPSSMTLLLFLLQLDDQELLCFLSAVEETLEF